MVGVPRWNCAKSWKVCSITIARRSKTYRQAICSDNKKPAPAGFFVSWWRWMWLSLKMWSRYYNGFQNAIRSLRCPSRWMPIRNWFLMWLLASWLSNKFWMFDVIAPVEVREKMSSQLKNIDFTNHPAAADPVTMRAIQKAIALIELKFTPQGESH